MVCQTVDAAEQAVWHSLNNFAYENAAFLAERLHAEEKFAEAEDALIGRSPAFANSLAMAPNSSSSINNTPAPGGLLLSTPVVNSSNNSSNSNALSGGALTLDAANNPDLLAGFGEIESFAYELLANICLRTGRPERAKRFLERAVAANPLLWNAYAQLCDMGAVKPSQASTVLRQLNSQPAVAAAINLSSPSTLSDFGLLQAPQKQSALSSTAQPSPKLPNSQLTTTSSAAVHHQNQTQQMDVDCSTPPAPVQTTIASTTTTAATKRSVSGHHTGLTQPPGAPAKRAPFRSRIAPAAPSSRRMTGGDSNLATLTTLPSGSTSSISSIGSGSSVVMSSARQILASVNPMSESSSTSGSGAIGGPVRRSQRLHAAAVKENNNNRSQVTSTEANAQPSSSSSQSTANTTSTSSRMTRLRPSTGGSGGGGPTGTTSSVSSSTSSGSKTTRQLRMADNENLKTRQQHHQSQSQLQSGNKTTRDPLGSIHQRIEAITDASKDAAEILQFQQALKASEASATMTINANNKTPSATSSQQSPSIASEDSQHRDASTISISVQWKTLSSMIPVISRLGAAYAALTSYACPRALSELDLIPAKHAKTSLVSSLIARAHYEAGHFENAVEVYSELHRMDPAWLVGMDRYSSALWRLQRVNDLVHLSLDLERVQPLRSQTWIAIGNAMSLEKERARAIRAFDRAVQLDDEKRSCSSYAHILAGYEHLLGDDLDRAEVRFRKAFACDPRNYAALVGLGQLQYKRKQFHDAVVSLDRAVQINPGNVTIYTQLALVLHALHHDHSALLAIDRALVLKPKDPSALFNRARIFYCMRQHRDALRVLAELKSVAPREAMAYMLQGKVYEALGDTAQAQLSFIWASQLTAGSAMAVQVRELVCHTAPPPVPLASGGVGGGGGTSSASSSAVVPPSMIAGGDGVGSHLNSSIPMSSSGVMLTGGSSSDSFDFGQMGHRFSAPPSSLVAAMALPGESFTVTMGVNDSAIVGSGGGGSLGGSDSFLSAAFGVGGSGGVGDISGSGVGTIGDAARDLIHDGDDEEDDDDDDDGEGHDDDEEEEEEEEDMYNSNNDDDNFEDELERVSSSAMQDTAEVSFEDALAAVAGEEGTAGQQQQQQQLQGVGRGGGGGGGSRTGSGGITGTGGFDDADDPMTGSGGTGGLRSNSATGSPIQRGHVTAATLRTTTHDDDDDDDGDDDGDGDGDNVNEGTVEDVDGDDNDDDDSDLVTL